MESRPPAGASTRPHLAFIDGLRALAALAVLWEHGIGCAYTVCKGSHEAWRFLGGRGVDLFFVISGFCLAYPFLARLAAGKPMNMDYLTFLAHRFARIVPPYYIVLGILGLLAFTPIGFPGDPSTAPVPVALAVTTFLRDMVFSTSGLQVYNVVFWTLGVEMRWYFVCPFLILLYVRSRSAFYLVIALLYALYWLPPPGMPRVLELGTLPCFMLGIVAADLILHPPAWRRFAWAAVPLVLLGIVIFNGASIDFAEPAWHLLCFLLVCGASTVPLRPIFEWRPLVVTGHASYSIYLVHLPVVWGLERGGMGPWPATAMALAAGFAFWWLVERPLLQAPVRDRLRAVAHEGLVRLAGPFVRRFPRPESAPTV
jgi:peptidoglycan/LPS O-acetylase OafA/YrhL